MSVKHDCGSVAGSQAPRDVHLLSVELQPL